MTTHTAGKRIITFLLGAMKSAQKVMTVHSSRYHIRFWGVVNTVCPYPYRG
jgi:hypothetical protein